MKVLILEPFFTGSHKAWAEGYQQFSSHQVKILSMSGHHWKWRMHGGAITLARKYRELKWSPDLILATDMLDLSSFLALTREQTANIPTILYFHENQLTYPRNAQDPDVSLKRDQHYSFINLVSALSADQVLFNSQYHFREFFTALPTFLRQFPDKQELVQVPELRKKSSVLPLGIDLRGLEKDGEAAFRRSNIPLLLWNHRWEYDKDPQTFFEALFSLKKEGILFQLAVLGEAYPQSPRVFKIAKQYLSNEIIHWGYAHLDEYATWLHKADLLPVSSDHDFFGVSVVEAMYCGCVPLVPTGKVYHEHIPPEFHHKLIYQEKMDFKEKLKFFLENHEEFRSIHPKEWVIKYDWQKLIPVYDQLLYQCVRNHEKTKGYHL